MVVANVHQNMMATQPGLIMVFAGMENLKQLVRLQVARINITHGILLAQGYNVSSADRT